MQMKYLHTMVRVADLDASVAFFALLGLEKRAAGTMKLDVSPWFSWHLPGQPECPVELTYNWDGDDGLPSDSRHFGIWPMR
jgi:lactoylglutathione lyase